VALDFTWDPRKAAVNRRKHGISFVDAATAFGDPLSVTIPDPGHSQGERRYVLVGVTKPGQLVVVAHSELGEQIRIISARPATSRERQNYEEGS
jgi:hypothetical protein